MAALAYPSLLTQASWERQAGAVAKARTVTLGAELKALEKCWKAVDFAAVEVAKLATVADVQACIGKLEGDFAKLVRAAFDQTRGVQDAAAKVEAQYRKDAGAKAALQAAAAVARMEYLLGTTLHRGGSWESNENHGPMVDDYGGEANLIAP